MLGLFLSNLYLFHMSLSTVDRFMFELIQESRKSFVPLFVLQDLSGSSGSNLSQDFSRKNVANKVHIFLLLFHSLA
jgi:hypothetical protein